MSSEAVPGTSKSKRMDCNEIKNVSKDGKDFEEIKDSDEGECPAPLFTSQYQVVKTILEYLNVNDLLHAAQVNQQWSDIGRIVRNQRKSRLYKILFHPFLPHTELAFEYFNRFDVSARAREMVESGVSGNHYIRPPVGRVIDVDYPDFIKNAEKHIHGKFLGAYNEAQMIIGFGTKSFDTYLKRERRNHKKTLCQRMKVILGEIPERLPCFLTFSHGLVATPEDSSKTLEIESRSVEFPCLNLFAIPKVPGLRMKLFTVSKRQNLALKGQESAQQFKSLFDIGGETEANLKGILFLHKCFYSTEHIVDSLHQYLCSNPNVALAGGIHDQILTSRNPDDRIISTGVLIYGDELVNVSTVLLAEGDTDPQKCREKIEMLKPAVMPDGNSFAFMFVCSGRGVELHRKPNAEAELFNSVFPNVPLIGAFTHGELCHEVINKVNTPGGEAQVFQPPEKIRYEYTTVFLLVSYKYPAVDSEDN